MNTDDDENHEAVWVFGLNQWNIKYFQERTKSRKKRKNYIRELFVCGDVRPSESRMTMTSISDWKTGNCGSGDDWCGQSGTWKRSQRCNEIMKPGTCSSQYILQGYNLGQIKWKIKTTPPPSPPPPISMMEKWSVLLHARNSYLILGGGGFNFSF